MANSVLKDGKSNIDVKVDNGGKLSLEDDHPTHDDERLMEMARQAPPFWKNRNLFILYGLMLPGCVVPAVTLGFDSAMMNGLQAVDTWNSCEFSSRLWASEHLYLTDSLSDFNNPDGALLGIMSAILPLGSICASPFVSWVGDRFGRRKGILLGSLIMATGGIIQGASVHSMPTLLLDHFLRFH